ncbi:MAG: hypothetical protein NC489_35525 [Ruminococcus flavefaciens]|nr:hypothetical protein [Ruminococcus flavefaciens]
MRYISDDGKVFDTEQECCEHEQKIKKIVDERNLDSNFFRIKNGDKWESRCFSDLKEEDMVEVLRDESEAFAKRLCIDLGKTIRRIGDLNDLICFE